MNHPLGQLAAFAFLGFLIWLSMRILRKERDVNRRKMLNRKSEP
jgi:flagellar biogenesis protein FliO